MLVADGGSDLTRCGRFRAAPDVRPAHPDRV